MSEKNDTSLDFWFCLARCSFFSHHFRMTMHCKMVDERRTPVRFYDEGISAGFSSPAQDYEELRLHLTDLLISNAQKPHSLPKPVDTHNDWCWDQR